MTEISELLNDIENLRENLNRLISEKGFNLQDPEVLDASLVLNDAIIKYNSLLKSRLEL